MESVEVEEVWIEGLYGEFDHRVRIEPDWAFAIVYGPNGVGKTRFFTTIDALGELRPRTLSQTPFRAAGIEYPNGGALSVDREETVDGVKLVFELLVSPSSDPVFWRWPPTAEEVDRNELLAMRREKRRLLRPNCKDLGDGTWESSYDDGIFTEAEVEAILGHDLPENTAPDVFEAFAVAHPVYFIHSQRLLMREVPGGEAERVARSRYGPTRSRPLMHEDSVSRYAKNLQSQLNQALVENSRKSQELDRSFPTRLLEASLQEAASDEETIRDRHTRLNEKRGRLVELGLTPNVPSVGLPEVDLGSLRLSVLNLHLSDSEEKLSSFDDVLRKADPLAEIVNQPFLRKRLEVSADQGLVIVPSGGGEPLDPRKLSSGEKHELVMFYDMIFSAPRAPSS